MPKDCTIIVPMYNEEKRLPSFLPHLIEFVKKRTDYTLLLVNDGSKDHTLEVAKKLTRGTPTEILTYASNQGKGAAVRKGILHTKTSYVLFIDADGSIQSEEIPKMLHYLKRYDAVVGDRYHPHSKLKRDPTRKIIGDLFNTLVFVLFQYNVKDNLCGFKGFKQKIAHTLFNELKTTGWLFDVELFYRIKKRGYTLFKMPIAWEHKEGSKIKPLDPLKMFFQLLLLRIRLWIE
ncbi:MAG: dolichyl-phosphate beta-glucosyltransferase [Nanoarchaeota archaeon]